MSRLFKIILFRSKCSIIVLSPIFFFLFQFNNKIKSQINDDNFSPYVMTKDGKNFVRLFNGKKIYFHFLTKEEYYLKIQERVDTLEQIGNKMSSKVYLLCTGELLIDDGIGYLLYSNYEELNALLKDFEVYGYKRNVLFGINLVGKDLLNKKNILIGELLENLSIPFTTIYDSNLLVKIEDRINSLSDKELFLEKYFLNLVVLLGDFFVVTVGGELQIESEDGITWAPFILYKYKKINYITYLYRDIFLSEEIPNDFITGNFWTIHGIAKNNI